MPDYLLEGGPLSIPPTTFLQDILAALPNHANEVFIEDTTTKRCYSFQDLHEKASGVCRHLKRLGVKTGDSVVIISNPTAETYFLTVGVWLAGASSIAINPILPVGEMQTLFQICNSKVFYVGKEFVGMVQAMLERLPQQAKILTPGGIAPNIDIHEVFADSSPLIRKVEQPLGKDHVIAVLFTSGTTGVPKGVVLRDEAIQFNNVLATEGYKSSDTLLNTSPCYWISNFFITSISLIKGIKIILTVGASPQQLLEIITKYKPTQWFTGPAILLDMCRVPNLEQYDTSSLVKLSVGGYTILPYHRKTVIDTLLNGRNIIRVLYGSTEGGLISGDVTEIDPESKHFSSVGRVKNGVVVKIIDQNTGLSLPPNKVGEICCKSPATIKSFINMEITEQQLDKDGFWHMGDIGYYDEEGYIYFESRSQDLMKYRGQQFTPAEIENVILRYPGVLECAVVGKPCESLGEIPTAFVVLKPNLSVSEEELFNFVAKEVLDEKKLRGGIYFVDCLPKSAVGKILRTELLKRLK